MIEPMISLYKYLQDNDLDNEKIAAHGLDLICMKCYKKEQKEYKSAMLEHFAQKLRTVDFIQEIIQIQKAFKKHGIKVIFIKGVPLAEDVYDSASIRRCTDIDIVIEYDKVYLSLSILDSLGYFQANCNDVEKGESIGGEYYKKYIDEFGRLRMHFPVFQKRVTNQKGKVKNIFLDCHICIFPNLDNYREKMEKCFENAAIQLFHGENIYVLSLYHRILHLIIHFTKDTYRDNSYRIFTGCSKGYHLMRLNLLHDIALLIYKYISIFKWEEFYQVVKEFNQIIPVYYTILFLKVIYGIKIPKEIEFLMQNNFPQSKTFMETMLVSCAEKRVTDILLGDQYKLMQEILTRVNFRGEILVNDSVKEFYIKAPSDALKYEKDTRTLVRYSNYAKGMVYIVDDSIFFNICIFGGEKYAPYYPIIAVQAGDGSIISKYQCIMPKIQFIADKTDKGIRSHLFLGMNEYLSNYKSSVYSMQGDLIVNLILDKELLPIKYNQKIIFNVEVDERDENGSNKRTLAACMSNYNVTNYTCFII